RRAWRTAPHPVIGDVRLMAPPFLLSGASQGPDRPGPLLGQHTEEVFRGIVGLDAAEYAACEAAGVFR
ncbi:MAG TPA: CoA transferase, partial [Verrucomicrobiae bacterium]|nr:CoA transferase [Verrucomicrobiae bacterium]